MTAFRREYPQRVEGLIRSELEIASRKTLSDKVFPAIRQIIMAELAYLSRIRRNLMSLSDHFYSEANRLQNLPDDFYLPVGRELANSKFVEEKFEEVIEKEGGRTEFVKKTFESFCSRHGSLAVFDAENIDSIQEFLVDHCRATAAGHLSQLNVLDVLKSTYPSQQQQYQLISHAIGQ